MSGTCHLQYRSKLVLLKVIAWLFLKCIWADRINGRKTQRSVTGDTVLLINHHRVLQPPCIRICWRLKKKTQDKGGGELVGGGKGGNLLSDIKWEFQPGCLREEVSKRGCVKVRHVHGERECQVKLIRVPWPFLLHFHVQQPRSTTGSSAERWETVMFVV